MSKGKTQGKFTSGPWRIEYDASLSPHIVIDTPSGTPEAATIQTCDYDDGLGERLTVTDWENAHLISAAPDMYEAIKQMLTWFDDDDVFMDSHEVEFARRALSKANGENHE